MTPSVALLLSGRAHTELVIGHVGWRRRSHLPRLGPAGLSHGNETEIGHRVRGVPDQISLRLVGKQEQDVSFDRK
jgi:hypothetical protein